MNGLRVFGKTSININDYYLPPSTTSEGLEYESFEMKIAAFIGLCCVMAVIFAIVLVWIIRRKWQTKQYTITQKKPEMSLPQDQRYISVQDSSAC